MTRFSVSLLAVLLASAVQPTTALSQERKIELGADAQFIHRNQSFESGGFKETDSRSEIHLPTGLRAGFFLSPRASIEVSLGLDWVDPSNGPSFSLITLGVGPMIHFTPDVTRAQGYVRPFLGVNYVNGPGDDDSQLFFGGALGLKVPMTRHAAMRYEILLQHAEQNSPFPRETRFGIAAGFSVFLP